MGLEMVWGMEGGDGFIGEVGKKAELGSMSRVVRVE